ncbi:MAG: presqualene diphosphate synthase HpnD [Nitrospirota bacterium]|nr:presqualene diphosphate synthase HpnD [Nitrospirota bacterium]
MPLITPAEAHAYCEQKTRASGSNFYYSFLFLPKRRRQAMYAVYTFCNEVDDTVDHPPPGTNPKEQLTHWRQEITAAYQGQPRYPVTISLADHVSQLDIPEEYLQELINGMEMDLTTNRYKTFDDLYPYCYRVAGVVGLICLKVFGTQSPAAKEYAVNLGLAFQLTNILRDVGADAERDRIYLPLEDLNTFGCTEEDLLANVYSPAFVELMKFQSQRAQGYYQTALKIYATLSKEDRRSLLAAEIMRTVYSRILKRIQAQRYQVFGTRISLSPSYRLVLAARCWFRGFLHNRLLPGP